MRTSVEHRFLIGEQLLQWQQTFWYSFWKTRMVDCFSSSFPSNRCTSLKASLLFASCFGLSAAMEYFAALNLHPFFLGTPFKPHLGTRWSPAPRTPIRPLCCAHLTAACDRCCICHIREKFPGRGLLGRSCVALSVLSPACLGLNLFAQII